MFLETAVVVFNASAASVEGTWNPLSVSIVSKAFIKKSKNQGNTVGQVNFIRKKFRHIQNRYTNENIERINLRTCALKTKFFPPPMPSFC